MSEKNQDLKVQEKKKGFSSQVGWLGFGLVIIIILIINLLPRIFW